MSTPLCSMRAVVVGAMLFASRSLPGQGFVGGAVVDSATGMRLPCVDVAIEDTTGRVVSLQQTSNDGTFQFEAPERGVYRLSFHVWDHPSIIGADEMIESSTERARTYRLAFPPALPPGQGPKRKWWPDTTDSPPGFPRDIRNSPLLYPDDLRRQYVSGKVYVHYVVDSTGVVQVPTIRVRASTDPQFSLAVTNFLRKVKFTPAHRDGQAVCAMIIDQPFMFEIKR